jgi:hypothetical protein
MIVYPTIELPPASFGTRDNPYSNMLVDRYNDVQSCNSQHHHGVFYKGWGRAEMDWRRRQHQEDPVRLYTFPIDSWCVLQFRLFRGYTYSSVSSVLVSGPTLFKTLAS